MLEAPWEGQATLMWIPPCHTCTGIHVRELMGEKAGGQVRRGEDEWAPFVVKEGEEMCTFFATSVHWPRAGCPISLFHATFLWMNRSGRWGEKGVTAVTILFLFAASEPENNLSGLLPRGLERVADRCTDPCQFVAPSSTSGCFTVRSTLQ